MKSANSLHFWFVASLLGSGINGNLSLVLPFLSEKKTGSLPYQEVELMETNGKMDILVLQICVVASLLGSGINGNLPILPAENYVAQRSLPYQEVELMETSSLKSLLRFQKGQVASLLGSGINGNFPFSGYRGGNSVVASLLGSGINGNLFRIDRQVCFSSRRFLIRKWN